MKRLICFVVCCAATWLSAQTIHFSGLNPVTLTTVELDSVYINNQTQQRDTLFVGTAFDLSTWTTVQQQESTMPARFALSENYPNAFESDTRFFLDLPESNLVHLSVYNILGQQVLQREQVLPSGSHQFLLNGGGWANGLYFLRVRSQGEQRTIKLLKSGSVLPAVSDIRYIGAASNRLGKKAADAWQFIAFAADFISDTLQVADISGQRNIQFEMMPVPPPDDFTSNWRGFNLLGKFTVEWSNDGYAEKDFDMISDFGFNFVRLPIDYRTYTEEGDWYNYIESELADIDNAVEWGQQYDIHVSINLHRAPGYCVNPPSTPLPPEQDVSLWTSQAAQQAFTEHWRMFAERYADVPVEVLSFNLVNEPADVDGDVYVDAVIGAVQAIREVSPDRIIISDAVDWGNARVDEILQYDVAMSPHFYNPFQLTHYKASWVNGSDTWPEPVWPIQLVSTYFYGSYKSDLQSPLVIQGEFAAGTTVTIHVQQVSTHADFRVRSGNETVFTKFFQPGPGDGEWEEVIYREEWNIYQNVYNRDYSFTIDSDVTDLSFQVLDGDWMTWSQLDIVAPNASQPDVLITPGLSDWGVPQASYAVTADGQLVPVKLPNGFEDRFKLNGFLEQWVELKEQGTPVHVGEWGVYNKTPHDVTLRFMENRLLAMKSAGLGWALWNFRGSFGILDSGRSDVNYESYRGHQLDREMLEILQSY